MKKLLIILAVIAALAGIGIYKLVSAVTTAGELGDAAVAVFHRQYNANAVADAYAAAAPAFRTGITPEDFQALAARLHDKLGEWKSGERTSIYVSNDNGQKTIELGYDAIFTKGTGTEEYLFDYNGEAPLLLSYRVKSPALDTGAIAEGGEGKAMEAK